MTKPRVRFAPSPTGYLHVGGLRTALYNYLFARKNGGAIVLRIEDTDRSRYVEGAVENLVDTLKWSGIEFDEGPVSGGQHGPYMQSQRLDIYKKYAEQLVSEGKAYPCFCSAERVQEIREQQQKEGQQPKYDKHCLTLSKEEVQQKIEAGEKHVIRMNIEPGLKVAFNDLVRERVEFSTDILDDQVLVKSDGYPTYHLANVVDDHLMEISHVIRGEEWLSSTPKHVLLYQFLGWELPVFAHLPLLLNPDKSKLSKRQGDVAVEDYRAKGYLRDALINFIALLGWNAGDDQEFYTPDELINAFSIERVNKAGAVFNVEKLNWLNEEHLKKQPSESMLGELKIALNDHGLDASRFKDDYLVTIIDMMKERITFVKEIPEKAAYFFKEPTEYDEKGVKKAWKGGAAERMTKLAERFENLPSDDKDEFEKALRALAEEMEVGAGKMIHPTRLTVTGVSGGPGLFDILSLLGKYEVARRMRAGVEALGSDE